MCTEPRGMTRRHLLLAGGVASTVGIWGTGAPAAHADPSDDDDYLALRAKWKAVLTGGREHDPTRPEVRAAIERIDAAAEQHYSSLQTGNNRAALWEDLHFDGGADSDSVNLYGTYERLEQLALAHQTLGSRYDGDPDLLAAVVDATDWMYEHQYNEDTPQQGKWFQWEIGSPSAVNAITTMLYDELGPERVRNYMAAVHRRCPEPAQTGANRMWRSAIVAGHGMLTEDDAKLSAARDGISQILRYRTSGDGFYTDGSFIQHGRHPYTGGYGVSLMSIMARFLYLLDGTTWQVQDPNLGNVFEWVTEGYAPWLYKGSMIGAVRGRAISRYYQQDHVVGHNLVRGIMWLTASTPPAQALTIKELVKHTIETDTFHDFYEYDYGHSHLPGNGLSSILRATQISGDADVEPRPPYARNKQYAAMDRVAHVRPGYTFALSMSSQRIYNYETISGQNVRGWYTGDGMHYLYNDDLAHYDDNYWATVDPYRLPGTTVPTDPRSDASGNNYLSSKSWVGGAALDTLGVTGMEFQTYGSGFVTYHLRLACDGHHVTVAWSLDGTNYVTTGSPSTIDDFAAPSVGMYAGRASSNAASLDARFERFVVRCGDELQHCADASDEFDGDTLDRDRWTRIVRENPDRYRVEDGALILPTDEGTFNNIVLQQMPDGPWQVDAVIRFEPKAAYQHAGIVLYQDDDNWVRIHRIMASGGDRLSFVDQRGGRRVQHVDSFPDDEFPDGAHNQAPTGRKAWFMIDDQVVALGTGIRSDNGSTLETIVENRKLDLAGRNPFIVDGTEQSTDAGPRDVLDPVGWAHLAGSTPGIGIGYVFPDATPLAAHRERRVGAWSDINARLEDDGTPADDPIERTYLTLMIEHGTDPDSARYGYVLLPNASVDETRAYAAEPGIEIVSNTPVVQAVRAGGILGATFWEDGDADVNGVACDKKAAVIVKHHGTRLDIAISDPTQTNDGRIRLEVRRAAGSVITQDSRIEIVRLRPSIVILFDAAGSRGQTAVAQLALPDGNARW